VLDEFRFDVLPAVFRLPVPVAFEFIEFVFDIDPEFVFDIDPEFVFDIDPEFVFDEPVFEFIAPVWPEFVFDMLELFVAVSPPHA